MEGTVFGAIILAIFGGLSLAGAWVFAYRPDSFDNSMADWFKPSNYSDPDVRAKRHANYRSGAGIGVILGFAAFVGAIQQLLIALGIL